MTPKTPDDTLDAGIDRQMRGDTSALRPSGLIQDGGFIAGGPRQQQQQQHVYPPARFQITAAAPQRSTFAPHLISDIVTTVAASHRHKHDNLPPADNDDVVVPPASRPPPTKQRRCGVPGGVRVPPPRSPVDRARS